MLANILIFYFYESFAGVYFSKLKIWLIFAFPKKDKAVPPGTMRNLLRDIFKRAWGMIVATGATWDAIAAEARDVQALRKRYVYPLVALAVLLSFVFNLMYAEERAFESAVLHAIITATTLFASYFAANAICLLFLQKKRPDLADRADCETVVAYSYTVILLVEMVNGLETVKGCMAESRMQRLWEAVAGISAQSSNEARKYSSRAVSFATFVTQMVTVGMVIWGVYRIEEGLMTMGALIGANILLGRNIHRKAVCQERP